ncbi:MAG: DUF1285 domain-containing protein [Pseudomonadales bacterium]
MAELDDLFDDLVARGASKKLPPVEQWQPERVGEIDIRIDTEGVWWHEGGEIKRQGLVNVFASVLRRDGEDYFLVTPVEKLRIVVEDVPFIGIDVERKGSGVEQEILVTTNVDDVVLVDPQHPIEMRDERPYVRVRGDLYARLSRAAFYRLVEFGLEEQGAWILYSRGARYALGSASA